MSKKNKNKRKQTQQRRDYHYQSTPATPNPAQTTPTESLLTPVHSISAAKAKTMEPSGEAIRQDIVRIVIILGIVAVLLLSTVIVSHKSTVIQRTGSRFSSFLQL
jgi:hypothetical protein